MTPHEPRLEAYRPCVEGRTVGNHLHLKHKGATGSLLGARSVIELLIGA